MGSNRKQYVLKIITDLEKLSVRAEEVNPEEPVKKVSSVINDIKRTLKANKNLVALSAPQLGYNKRIFCIKFKGNEIMTFVNPLITKSTGSHLSRETNASLTAEYIIPRSDSIVAMYQDEHGKIVENKFEDMASEMFEQMNQLLDGILLSDYGLEVLDGFDDLSDEDRQTVLTSYIEYLKSFNVELDAEIESDVTTRDMKKAMEFMKSVALGETEVVPEINGELDFSQSTITLHEKEMRADEARAQILKDKIEEIKNRDQCL